MPEGSCGLGRGSRELREHFELFLGQSMETDEFRVSLRSVVRAILPVLWFLGAIFGVPFLAYNLLTLLKPVMHSNADGISLLLPLALGTFAIFMAASRMKLWERLLCMSIYSVCMAPYLFVVGAGWSCANGLGCM